MRRTIKILILDNSIDDVEKISKCLIDNGYTQPIVICGDEISYLARLNEIKPDVILSEHSLPEYNSFRALDAARRKYPNVAFILISGSICEEFAIELLKEGIDDYVLKNHILKLPYVIESSYIKHRQSEELSKLTKINQELLATNTIIDTKNRSILQSIIFAERIQTLTLPKIDNILKEFPEAFVIYRPKDIVSGDFYWVRKKDNMFMAVVGDCTGHGVSGALLSMIGTNFLNEIVENSNNFLYPTDILSLLDLNIRTLLQQDKTSGYHDGIDIAFTVIDKENKKIYFSGCKRPLLIYRRKDKNIFEYKGEPYVIGGIEDRVTKKFTTQEISYRTSDIIYMYSDGAVDQFGGSDDRKLMKNRFVDMLLSIKHLELKDQGQLLDRKLIRWIGQLEQTDDITVMGIKL